MSFSKVSQAYPWPPLRPYPNPILHTLDGGGREILVNRLRAAKAPVVLEVGAFLGGSALQWLNSGPSVRVVCVDPWEGDWWIPYAREHGWKELEQRFAEPNGPLKVFLTNLWDYRDRVIAVPGYVPAKLRELHDLELQPQLIYFDSDKSGAGIAEAARLFPDAVIAGDDWTWGRQDGYPIRAAVAEVARQSGRHIVTKRCTWLLQDRPLTFHQRRDRILSLVADVSRPVRDRLRG